MTAASGTHTAIFRQITHPTRRSIRRAVGEQLREANTSTENARDRLGRRTCALGDERLRGVTPLFVVTNTPQRINSTWNSLFVPWTDGVFRVAELASILIEMRRHSASSSASTPLHRTLPGLVISVVLGSDTADVAEAICEPKRRVHLVRTLFAEFAAEEVKRQSPRNVSVRSSSFERSIVKEATSPVSPILRG